VPTVIAMQQMHISSYSRRLETDISRGLFIETESCFRH